MTGRPVAMVLSGGGAKTAAHLGACRAAREAGFEPVWYVATSMGAVIAAGLLRASTPSERTTNPLSWLCASRMSAAEGRGVPK